MGRKMENTGANQSLAKTPRSHFWIVTISLFAVTCLLVFLIWPHSNATALYIETIVFSGFWGLMGYWAFKRDGIPFKVLGVSFSKAVGGVMLFAIAWLIIIVITTFVTMDKAWYDAAGDSFSPVKDIVKLWIFVGIGEELLFRGYFLNRLLENFKLKSGLRKNLSAVGYSSMIFALYHIPSLVYHQSQGAFSPGLINLLLQIGIDFILGVLFAYYYLRTRNLLFCGLLHGSLDAPLVYAPDAIGGKNTTVLIALGVFIIVVEGWILLKKLRQKILKVG
jgi:uncharacterized protein